MARSLQEPEPIHASRPFFSISSPRVSEVLVATRQENLKSPAFDNVYSVPVQAA
jgi:hypothetical protein